MELKTNLPIKYKLSIHRLHPNYPELNDVLFDLCSFIFKLNKRKKHWKVEDMHLSTSAIKDVFVDLSDEEIKAKIKNILSELNNKNYITIADDQLHITEIGLNLLYNI